MQQQLHTLENSLEEKLTDLQQQLGNTKSSLTVKDAEFQTLKNSLWKSIEKLQEQLDRLQSNDKIRVSDIEIVQTTLLQISEKNTEYEKRDKKNEMLIKTLQRDINELKQQKSGYNHNEADTYKTQTETERNRAAKIEEDLKQSSVELQEKQKEAIELKKSQHELQLTVRKLEDALRVSENELNSKKTQYSKEIQQYKNLYDAERENTAKMQQLSAELQEKSKEALAAGKRQDELQSIVKKLEDALKQSESQHVDRITEYTKEIQHYKTLYADEKESLTKLSAELQEKTEEAITAKKNQDELQATVKKLEDALMQSESKHGSNITEDNNEIQQYKGLYATEKENNVKLQDTLTQVSARLQEKTEEAFLARKAEAELQSTVNKLQDALKQFKSENDSTEYTKEMQQYKDLYETEKENTVKAQEDLRRISTELQKNTKEILSLKESHQKWLHEKQGIEKQLEDNLKQYDSRIKEMEDNNKHLQVEKESATEQQLALQSKNLLLIQEKEHLESAIRMLQDENNLLKTVNKEQDRQLLEHSKKQNENDMLKVADKEQNRQLLENFETQAHGDQEVAAKALTVSKEQYCTLEERFHETLNEKQSKELATRDLQNASEQSQSEVENQKLKAENLEELQQLNELPSPVDQNYKSNVTSASEESSADHIKGGDDEDTEVFEPKETPLRDPPVKISITAAKEWSSETPINPDTITERKFMVTSAKKNPAESSTKLRTENQSAEVLSKTQFIEHHATVSLYKVYIHAAMFLVF